MTSLRQFVVVSLVGASSQMWPPPDLNVSASINFTDFLRSIGRASSGDVEAIERCPPRDGYFLNTAGKPDSSGITRWPDRRRVFLGAMVSDYDLDQVEAMLFELADLVERFILVEADHTHQGVFRRQLLPGLLAKGGRLELYAEKVISHLVHLDAADCQKDTWICEGQQRDVILDVAVDAGLTAGRDVLVSGDGDEIPSREVVNALSHCNFGHWPMIVAMPNHIFNLQWEYATWLLVLAAPAEVWMDKDTPSLSVSRRAVLKNDKLPYWTLRGPNNGWHLSFFGGIRAVQLKLGAYAHNEWARAPYNTPSYIFENMRDGKDPFRRGPLTPSLHPFRPRIVGVRQVSHCWLDSINACRDRSEILHDLVPPSCWARFLNADLGRYSDVWKGALQKEPIFVRHRTGCASSVEPAVSTVLRLNLGLYSAQRRESSELVRSFNKQLLSLSTSVLTSLSTWHLCVPVACLSDGQELLKLASRFFFSEFKARTVPTGFLDAEMPSFRREELALDFLPPLGGHGLTPVRLLPGRRLGAASDRRLVLAFSAAEGPEDGGRTRRALHTFLGSMRRAQVDAQVTIIVANEAADTECQRVIHIYDVKCEEALRLRMDVVNAPLGYQRWSSIAEYLDRLPPTSPFEEVLAADLAEVVFQADPFETRPPLSGWRPGPGLMPYVLLAAEEADSSGNAVAAQRIASPSTPFTPLSGAVLLGTTREVRRLATSMAEHLARSSEQTLASLDLGVSGLPLFAAPPEAACLCSMRPLNAARLGPKGLAVNRLGKPCAVVADFRHLEEFASFVQFRYMPGGSGSTSERFAAFPATLGQRLQGAAQPQCNGGLLSNGSRCAPVSLWNSAPSVPVGKLHGADLRHRDAAFDGRTPINYLICMTASMGVEPMKQFIRSALHHVPQLRIGAVLDAAAGLALASWWRTVPHYEDRGARLYVYVFEILRVFLPGRWINHMFFARSSWLLSSVLDDLSQGGSLLDPVPDAVIFRSPGPIPRPDGVLISDVRDVIFQGDPFEPLWTRLRQKGSPGGSSDSADASAARVVVAAQESAHMRIGQCPMNRQWILDCFGEAALEVLEDEHIFCDGTILGTWQGVRLLLKEGVLPAMEASRSQVCNQASHNLLLHHISPRNALRLWTSAAGAPAARVRAALRPELDVWVAEAEGDWVCTVGYLSETRNLRKDSEGYIISSITGRRCALVHQFDRIPKQAAFYGRLWASSD